MEGPFHQETNKQKHCWLFLVPRFEASKSSHVQAALTIEMKDVYLWLLTHCNCLQLNMVLTDVIVIQKKFYQHFPTEQMPFLISIFNQIPKSDEELVIHHVKFALAHYSRKLSN